MPETMTVDEIVAELTTVLEVTRDNRMLVQRLSGGALTVLYEFREVGADGTVGIRPHVLHVGQHERRIEAGAVPHDAVDIVIRAEPITLHRLTSGELSGREAIVSGMLDIRKAPSLPKLLLMRGLFNQYKKARGRAVSGSAPDEQCSVVAAAEAVGPAPEVPLP